VSAPGTDRPTLGQILDGLGCTPTFEQDDLVESAVVVMKIVEPDGTVRLSITWSDGTSWIERLGLLTAAKHLDLPVQATPFED
jgi:hypothetical protein